MRCTCNLCEHYSVKQLCVRVGLKSKPFDTCAFSRMWFEKYYTGGQTQNQLPWNARAAFTRNKTSIYRNAAPIEVEQNG